MTERITIDHGLNELCKITPAYKQAADLIRERMYLSLDVPVKRDRLKAVLIKHYETLRIIEKYSKIAYLERHAYAPELNKIHITDGRAFKVPYKKELDLALEYLIMNNILA